MKACRQGGSGRDRCALPRVRGLHVASVGLQVPRMPYERWEVALEPRCGANWW